MPISPEMNTPGLSSQKKERDEIDEMMSSLGGFELMEQVFERDELVKTRKALEQGGVEAARKELDHPLSLAEQVNQIRIRDFFPKPEDSPEWDRKLEEAERLHGVADRAIREYWQRRTKNQLQRKI